MKRLLILALVTATPAAMAATEVTMHRVSADGVGDAIGTVTFSNSEYGMLIEPDLKGLEPGVHGFHVHRKPSCQSAVKDGDMTAAAAAGGHFDPDDTGRHRGPYSASGHLGDLPALTVDSMGNATTPLLAPRLEVGALARHAVMIHGNGDNYADQPNKLGGGGPRVACGVIE